MIKWGNKIYCNLYKNHTKLKKSFACKSFFKNFAIKNFHLYLQSKNERGHSSAGLEHLPYKQRVRGSNPCAPTKKSLTLNCGAFFIYTLLVTSAIKSRDLSPTYRPNEYLYLALKTSTQRIGDRAEAFQEG